jgi:hypothetical protein
LGLHDGVGSPQKRLFSQAVSPSSALIVDHFITENTIVRRYAVAPALVIASSIAAALLGAAAPVAAAACPNEAVRQEQAAVALPDCRAYELVTPTQKDATEPKAVVAGLLEPTLEAIPGARAAADGGRMAWDSEYVLPGSPSVGVDYLSTRTDGGWSTEAVVPPQSAEHGVLCPFFVGMVGWSANLDRGVLADGYGQEPSSDSYSGEGQECGHDEPRLAAGEQEGFQNLFLRDNELHAYRLIDVTPSGVTPPSPAGGSEQYFPASFLAGSSDLSHVVFEDELPLTPEAPAGDDLYEWAAGAVRLVTVLPNGEAAAGTLAGSTPNAEFDFSAGNRPVPINLAGARRAVSSDGRRIFFEAGEKLYLREDGEHTIQIDAAQGPGPGGGGRFMGASEDGSRVFFLDDAEAGLTSNTISSSGANLYEYDIPSGRLTDLTAAADVDVLGVSGLSADGSTVYFVAEGALAGGAAAGQPNLYAEHDGELAFVATLDPQHDSCDWTTNTGCPLEGQLIETSGLTARSSTDGRYVAFTSLRPLTGQSNVDAHTGEADTEVFRYDLATGTLACASCSPTGAAPTGPATIRWPSVPITFQLWREAYPQRNVSDQGQVFFETKSPLVLADINTRTDVYEYDGNSVSLLSSGTSEADSYFLDASQSGDDVFLATAQRLVGRDQDSAYDIYDARVGGGFAEPAPPAPGCGTSEGCRPLGQPVAPLQSPPASVTFLGPGNPTAAPSVHCAQSRTRGKRSTTVGKHRARAPKKKTRARRTPSRGRRRHRPSPRSKCLQMVTRRKR